MEHVPGTPSNMAYNAVLPVVVPPGTLEAPSGLVMHEGFIYVSDATTSKLHAFDLDGMLVRSLDSGLPAQSLAGLTVGPDNKLYFVDAQTSRVLRRRMKRRAHLIFSSP